MKAVYAKMITPRLAAIGFLISMVAAVAGPFGTFDLIAPGMRFVYWTLVVFLSIFLGFTARAIIAAIWPSRRSSWHICCEVPLATGMIAAMVWAVTQAITSLSGAHYVPSFPRIVFYVASVSVAVATVRGVRLLRWGEDNVAETTASARLLKRLPDALGGRVLHLSVEDHFVDVTTDRGTERIRMRFRDAIDEMDGVEGFRVHRSHWVARAAIARVGTEQGRTYLELVNDSWVPVSRNYRAVLEEAGIL